MLFGRLVSGLVEKTISGLVSSLEEEASTFLPMVEGLATLLGVPIGLN